jgi:FMN phosphatase YigB (HAD superfamily)
MSIATQTRLRAHAGLPFDKLLSGETVKAYKPNAAVYQMAVSSLNIRPAEILMVAAHKYDLNAANGQGFRTTLIKIGAKVVSHGRLRRLSDGRSRDSENSLRRHLAADRGTAAAAGLVNSVRRSIVTRSNKNHMRPAS